MMKESLFEKHPGTPLPQRRWPYALFPVFLLFFNYLVIGSHYVTDPEVFAGATLLNGAVIAIAFMLYSRLTGRIAVRYAGLDQALKRITLSFAVIVLLLSCVMVLTAWLYLGLGLFRSAPEAQTLIVIFAVTLGAAFLATGITETFHAIDRWRQYEVNKERLMKENVNGQLESLKAQISPHFLFNTLNSLSALIGEDPEKAEQFVDEMARVYRYLLQTNHSSVDEGDFSQLTTLRKELSFIQSYGHLLKTRYGDGMKLYVHVEDMFLEHRIPPLTLQLLVENAVKHNVIRASRPLSIFILSTVDGQLMVRNNLQKKNLTAGAENIESTQVGLGNIFTKYKLLGTYQPGLPQPVIDSNHEFFTVTLPLIS